MVHRRWGFSTMPCTSAVDQAVGRQMPCAPMQNGFLASCMPPSLCGIGSMANCSCALLCLLFNIRFGVYDCCRRAGKSRGAFLQFVCARLTAIVLSQKSDQVVSEVWTRVFCGGVQEPPFSLRSIRIRGQCNHGQGSIAWGKTHHNQSCVEYSVCISCFSSILMFQVPKLRFL